MDMHRCKLCFKSFSNGRALGGHMRSHMLNLPFPPKPEKEKEQHPPIQPSEDTRSASFSEEEAEEEEEDKSLCYGLRENPKRSIRLVDPEFSFAADAASVLQDRESETESSKNPTRRRSKRTRKLLEHPYQQHRQEQESNIKKINFSKFSKTESWAEAEPGQMEENGTKRTRCEAEDEKSIEETDESDEFKSCKTRTRGKYRCDTCKKVFKSYQALGGHRASHKKLKVYTPSKESNLESSNVGTSSSMAEKKIHECPYCFRVFSSGQALGGHKRSHLTGVAATPARSSSKIEDNLNLIDLNLPAPIDDDDLSQIELSAVSDAEFVNHIKR
ncbi:hypothetical protein GH714_018862 [Hevea brasiliensis]|uniref:C2H2-type domain-containing protein n=1 Tax=Hevea brasiliensis TaxID=3981 RepID=A0A6A6LSN6_HEVBR|nr:hypothetical protein GH714_018862 [Hevea brasiliensis]